MAKQKVGYVDGFVLVVPKKNKEAYKKMAKEGAKVWMKYGALSYKECVLDDAKPKFVTLTFPKLTKIKPSEEVWYSYIEYKSKTHRDQVNKKVMAEMEKYAKENPDHMKNMPFDMKKLSFGGFKVSVGS